MLFPLWNLEKFRSTSDVDFLGEGDMAPELIKAMFIEICAVERIEDGLVFHARDMKLETTRAADPYGGIKVSMVAMLPPKTKIRFQADIGIGDAAGECGFDDFPSLLNFRRPRVRAYSMETSISEKFHAICRLGEINSRLKDYFDIWLFSKHREFRLDDLVLAFRATFSRRKTDIPLVAPAGLTSRFVNISGKKEQWNSFCRKSLFILPYPELQEVIDRIAAFVELPLSGTVTGADQRWVWDPANGAWLAVPESIPRITDHSRPRSIQP